MWNQEDDLFQAHWVSTILFHEKLLTKALSAEHFSLNYETWMSYPLFPHNHFFTAHKTLLLILSLLTSFSKTVIFAVYFLSLHNLCFWSLLLTLGVLFKTACVVTILFHVQFTLRTSSQPNLDLDHIYNYLGWISQTHDHTSFNPRIKTK